MNTLGKLLLGALGIGAIAAVAGTSTDAGASPSGGSSGGDGNMASNALVLWSQLRAVRSLTENQRLFLMLVAKGESNYSPTAWNKTPSESAAAGRAYDRLLEQDRLSAACSYTREELAIGSVGRFQRLAPYFVNDLRNVKPCADPQLDGRDGFWDIVSAIATAAALSRNGSWNGRVSGLRGGWGTLAWLGGPPADKVAKWRGHARAAKLMGEGRDGGLFLDVVLTPFPSELGPVVADLLAHRAAGAPSA